MIRFLAFGKPTARRSAVYGPPLGQESKPADFQARPRHSPGSEVAGWKRDVGRRLDEIIVRTVPGVRKAVKWNSPFYGVVTAFRCTKLPRESAQSLC
jgi:hypothetical protein